MDEILKQIMGESYKEDMTQEEVQNFFKNQVLGEGKYVNKEMAEAEKKKLQDQLDAKNLELQNKLTDEEKILLGARLIGMKTHIPTDIKTFLFV